MSERILVIRRDNIGDLVCTTPLLTALRHRFPGAWIGALVNSYNAPVLAGNPDLDEVIAYTKLKHLEEGESALSAVARRARSLWRLRRQSLDYVVLATTDFVPRLARMARWLAPRCLVGFSDGSASARMLERSMPVADVASLHEVERVFHLGRLLGVEGPIPALTVVPDAAARARGARALAPFGSGIRVAIHISARRPAQRWPASRFADLIDRLHSEHGATAILLWSPGSRLDRRHPGDDEKAREVMSQVKAKAVLPYPTARLEELIGMLASCDAAICADGGAMHIAAALRKPLVALFGDSPVERWHPWGVPYRVVRAASRDVADLPVEAVAGEFSSLAAAMAAGPA